MLVNTGTFLVNQYCPKMWYLHSLENASVIQKLTILECKNSLVLSNTCVLVSGTYSTLFSSILCSQINHLKDQKHAHLQCLELWFWLQILSFYPFFPRTWTADDRMNAKLNLRGREEEPESMHFEIWWLLAIFVTQNAGFEYKNNVKWIQM